MLTYLSGVSGPKRIAKRTAKQAAKTALIQQKAAKKAAKQTARQTRIKSGVQFATTPAKLTAQRIKKAKVEQARKKASMVQPLSVSPATQDELFDNFQQVDQAYNDSGNFEQGIEDIDTPEFSEYGSADSDFYGEDMGVIYPMMSGPQRQAKKALKLQKKSAKIQNIKAGRPGLQKTVKLVSDTAKKAYDIYTGKKNMAVETTPVPETTETKSLLTPTNVIIGLAVAGGLYMIAKK